MTQLETKVDVLAQKFSGLFLDLDGVCYLGEIAAPNASKGLAQVRKLGLRQAFITNNSGRTAQVVATHLTDIGIPAKAEEVITSAMSTADQMLNYLPLGANVLCIGGEGIKKALLEAGFKIVSSADSAPAAVVQGLDANIGWHELSEVALAIKAGAQYFATNLDATIPKERGEMLGNGSLVAAVKNATEVSPISSGKPDSYIYEFARKITGFKDVLAVGDRLNTDIAGAVNSRIPSIHVLTGVNTARDVVLAPAVERPTYLGIDMLDICLPYPEISVDISGDVNVEGSVAAIRDGKVKVDGAPIGAELTLNQYRAVASVVWNLVGDNGAIGCEEKLGIPDFKVVR